MTLFIVSSSLLKFSNLLIISLTELFESVSSNSNIWNLGVSLVCWLSLTVSCFLVCLVVFEYDQLQFFLGMPRGHTSWTSPVHDSPAFCLVFLSCPGSPQSRSRRSLCHLQRCVKSSHVCLQWKLPPAGHCLFLRQPMSLLLIVPKH